MKFRYFACVILILSLSGCGAYTELKPKPALSSLEGDYIELTKAKSDKKTERFELKAKKKYYMRFPPQSKDIYLVLRTDQLALMDAYLTRTFTKGKRPPVKIRDEGGGQKGVRVYRMDRSVPEFFWVIDTVSQDFLLTVTYRYVPVWRYTFESKRDEFQDRLSRNRIDRAIYNTLGASYHFNTPESGANHFFSGELSRVAGAYDALQALRTEMENLERVFPPSVLNSNDRAYRDYVVLKEDLDEEIMFQENYRDVLTIFRTDADTRGDMGAFLNASPDFVSFLGQIGRFPPAIIREGQRVVGNRMQGVVPYLEQQIANKNEVSPITFGFDLGAVNELYQASDRNAPSKFLGLRSFIDAYNTESGQMIPAQSKLAEAERYSDASYKWPSNGHYTEALGHISALNGIMPAKRTVSFADYNHFRCVTLLNEEVQRIRQQATSRGRDYAAAQGVVKQINTLRPQRKYRAIIQLLSSHRRLGFLLQQYPNVDQLSLEQQQTAITVSLESQAWQNAETQLRDLHGDEVFLRPNSIVGLKRATVERLEEQLATAIEQGSKQRVDAFVDANKLTIDNVEGLYMNPVFTPVHALTFTSGSAGDLARRNGEVQSYLDKLKHEVLPASAIPEIYREFTRNTNDRGVEKARAVVIHGQNYRGTDRRIKNLVAECDPYTPKWISRPTEYRKIYVLPTSNNPTGENQYMFRLNVRIPSKAKFPVFDVNLKLPPDIAAEATTSKWYDYITLNKEPLNPEGRFTITAPTAENNYEAQLTPVQMKASENNILEVQFTHPSFQVFEISTMSQRPIMRKD